MTWLEFQYFLLVFVASCGLLQGVFTYRRVSGLQFFRSPAMGYVLAALLFLGSFAWFFSSEERDIPPIVVEGSQQTVLFLVASASAVFFTCFVSSLASRRRLPATCTPAHMDPGLEDLKQVTYVRCLLSVGKGVGASISRRVGLVK